MEHSKSNAEGKCLQLLLLLRQAETACADGLTVDTSSKVRDIDILLLITMPSCGSSP